MGKNLDKDSSEEALAKYLKTPKGKKSQRKYRQSDLGKATGKRYMDSELGKAALLRYQLSSKGKATKERQAQERQLLSQCQKFLEQNPNLTPEDFLASLSNSHEEPILGL